MPAMHVSKECVKGGKMYGACGEERNRKEKR